MDEEDIKRARQFRARAILYSRLDIPNDDFDKYVDEIDNCCCAEDKEWSEEDGIEMTLLCGKPKGHSGYHTDIHYPVMIWLEETLWESIAKIPDKVFYWALNLVMGKTRH